MYTHLIQLTGSRAMAEHRSKCLVMVSGKFYLTIPPSYWVQAQGNLLLTSFWVPFLLFFFFCVGKVGVRDSVWNGIVIWVGE